MNITERTQDFFRKHNMHYEIIDKKAEVDKFLAEMQAGLNGETSSLLMLPTYIYVNDELPFDKPVITIDAGGTNLRVAVVTLKSGADAEIIHFKKYPMPGSKEAVDKDTFYRLLADYVEPLLSYSDTISFCFSYPAQALPNQDGRVMRMSKEIKIPGLEGTIIGEELNRVFAERGLPAKHFVVLNDTVAAMLGAVGNPASEGHVGNIGFILGTGLNNCYGEKLSNISKIEVDNPRHDKMIINIESGGYSDFPRGTADFRLESITHRPDEFLFEKMVSGAYQGHLIYHTANLAIEEGMFSDEFSENFSKCETFHLWDVDTFAESPFGENPLSSMCHNNQDRQTLLEIIHMINHRGAILVSINIAAILIKSGLGASADAPAAITAEGTTFYKSLTFQHYFKAYTESFIKNELGLYCNFLKIENANLLGTAVAGLSE